MIGASTLALFMGIVQLSNDMRNPLIMIIEAMNQWQTTKPLVAKIKQAQTGAALTGKTPITAGPIVLKDASVTLGKQKIFDSRNLTIKPGQKY